MMNSYSGNRAKTTSFPDDAEIEELIDGPPSASKAAPSKQERRDQICDEMNRHFALVYNAGRTVHAHFTEDGWNFGTVEALHTLFANRTVKVKRRKVPISQIWLEHPRRATYAGITFDPNGGSSDKLNLWTGWGIEPTFGNRDGLIRRHILEVLCDGNLEHFHYMMGWLADLVQNPGRKPGVALVLRGQKGAGKDTLGVLAGRIVGKRHVAHIDKPDLLTARFNAHLATALLVHVEEAFWAGDRGKRGTLQSLITAPTMSLERKGIDVGPPVASFCRLIMTTNEDWVIPASNDERRYAVFDVSSKKIGNHDYFKKLYDEIHGYGASDFLHSLRSYRRPFNVKAVPQTKALASQKLESLSGVERWWFDILESGELPTSGFGNSDWRVRHQRS